MLLYSNKKILVFYIYYYRWRNKVSVAIVIIKIDQLFMNAYTFVVIYNKSKTYFTGYCNLGWKQVCGQSEVRGKKHWFYHSEKNGGGYHDCGEYSIVIYHYFGGYSITIHSIMMGTQLLYSIMIMVGTQLLYSIIIYITCMLDTQ